MDLVSLYSIGLDVGMYPNRLERFCRRLRIPVYREPVSTDRYLTRKIKACYVNYLTRYCRSL